MKYTKSTIAVILLVSTSLTSVSFAGSMTDENANKFNFIANDNKRITKACVAAATDQTKVMRDNLRRESRNRSVLSFRTFVNLIKCNDEYIGNFARKYGAQNTFSYLDKYTNLKNRKRQPIITIKKLSYKKENTKTVLISSN